MQRSRSGCPPYAFTIARDRRARSPPPYASLLGNIRVRGLPSYALHYTIVWDQRACSPPPYALLWRERAGSPPPYLHSMRSSGNSPPPSLFTSLRSRESTSKILEHDRNNKLLLRNKLQNIVYLIVGTYRTVFYLRYNGICIN